MIPWLVQHVLGPAHEVLMRRPTFAALRELQATEWLSAQKLRELQLAKLQDLVAVALNCTEAYASFAGVDRSWRPASLEDLARLPLIDKGYISSHREELVNRRVPGGAIRYRTGGSSGQPLIFYIDRRRQAYDKAARMRSHQWWGAAPGQREAYIWNAPVELSKQDRLKRLRDWLTNERLFPASELSAGSIGRFVAGLQRFGPRCLFGYPSAIALLCGLARSAGLALRLPTLKVVFTTGEVLYEHQRKIISDSFGAPVADCYGSREAGFIAHQCPAGAMHVTSENVVVEILRDGLPAAAGEGGEIVVTHLDNHAMPFIRYRTGDIGEFSTQLCPCGRAHPTLKVIQGRTNDFLVAPDGRRIHGSAVHAALSGIPGIVKFQLIQEADCHVRILLVTDAQFPPGGQRLLLDGILERLGPGGKAAIEMCDDIAPGPAGKHRYIMSEVEASL